MGFDADAYRRARAPWSVTLDGRTHVAAWLSAEEAKEFERQRMAAVKSTDEAAILSAMRWLLRRLFPWRPRYLWSGDPVARIMGLGLPMVVAAVNDFFHHRARTIADLATPGTSSVPRTPTPTPAPTSPS